LISFHYDVAKQKQFVDMQQFWYENWRTKGTSLTAQASMGVMSYLGMEDTPENRSMVQDAAVITGGVAAGLVANSLLKKTTKKGVLDHLRSTVSGKSVEQSGNNTSNGHHNNHTKESEHKFNNHSEPPSSSIHSRMTNSNIKTKESKSFFKRIGHSFMNTKKGKVLGAGFALIGATSLKGNL
jgi:hypothetical protein